MLKVGDVVKRVGTNFKECYIGKEYIITEIRNDHIQLEGLSNQGYDIKFFELIKSVNQELEIEIW